MQVLRKYSIIIAVLLFVYSVGGFLIMPLLVRYFGEGALREHLSPESEISKVRINPYLLSLQVEGLRTADTAGMWTAEWQSLEIDLSVKTLIKWYPIIDRISLDESAFSFERTASEQEDIPSEPEVSDGWRPLMEALNAADIPKVSVDLLEVSECEVTFVDLTNSDAYRQVLKPINFSLSHLTTVAEDATTMRLSAKTPRGAFIQWEGSVGTQPLRSQGSFSLEGLSLEQLSPYYNQFTRFELKRAVLGLGFEYVFDTSDLDNLLRVHGAHVGLTELLCEASDESSRLISIDEVSIEGGSFKFPQMELGIERIGVSDGQTLVYRSADGAINLTGLVAVPGAARAAEVQAGAADAAEESGFTYNIGLIEILNYQVSWEEELSHENASLSIGVPALRIEGVSSDLEAPFTFFADYRLGETGKVVLQGTWLTAATKLDTSLSIESVSLDTAASYAKEFGGVLLESGVLDFEGQVSYDRIAGVEIDGSGKLSSFAAVYGDDLRAQWETLAVDVSAGIHATKGVSLTGALSVDGFAGKSGANSLDASWALLNLEGISLTTVPLAFGVDRVALNEPAVTLHSGAHTPTEDTSVEGESIVATETAPAEPVAVVIGEVSVERGSVTIVDESVAPSATTAVTQLNAQMDDYDLAGSKPITLELSAAVNKSPFKLSGKLQPNDLRADTTLQFQLSRLSLPVLSAYSGPAVGRRISKGTFSIEGDWTVQGAQLKASNKIQINQLKFGDKVDSETAVKLPLDLAVTLLAGPSGEMDLSLPLSGDLSDPKVSIGQIVRTAVVGLVTNVAAAPFKLLSGIVDTDEDLSVVQFPPGEADLSDAMLDRLNSMADALKQRPDLSLGVIPVISLEDERVLTERILRADILDDGKRDNDKAFRAGVTDRYQRLLKEGVVETDADEALAFADMLSAVLQGVQLPDEDIARLASERSAIVMKHFTVSRGIDAQRLQVLEAERSDEPIGLRFDL